MLNCTSSYLKALRVYIPVDSGGGDTVGCCGLEGVSRGVESEMKEGGEGCSIGCSGDAVAGVKHEEVTSVGPGVACECLVGDVVVLAASAGDGGS